MTQKTEIAIPEDLKEEYQELVHCAPRDSVGHYMNRCAYLIRRLSTAEQANARLEAENAAKDKQLREWIKVNGPGGWIDDLRNANAALRQRVESMGRPVSDEEWGQRAGLEDQELWRKGFDRTLEARANPDKVSAANMEQQKGRIQ